MDSDIVILYKVIPYYYYYYYLKKDLTLIMIDSVGFLLDYFINTIIIY